MTKVINLFSVAFAFVGEFLRILFIGALLGAIICSPFMVLLMLALIYWG